MSKQRTEGLSNGELLYNWTFGWFVEGYKPGGAAALGQQEEQTVHVVSNLEALSECFEVASITANKASAILTVDGDPVVEKLDGDEKVGIVDGDPVVEKLDGDEKVGMRVKASLAAKAAKAANELKRRQEIIDDTTAAVTQAYQGKDKGKLSDEAHAMIIATVAAQLVQKDMGRSSTAEWFEDRWAAASAYCRTLIDEVRKLDPKDLGEWLKELPGRVSTWFKETVTPALISAGVATGAFLAMPLIALGAGVKSGYRAAFPVLEGFDEAAAQGELKWFLEAQTDSLHSLVDEFTVLTAGKATSVNSEGEILSGKHERLRFRLNEVADDGVKRPKILARLKKSQDEVKVKSKEVAERLRQFKNSFSSMEFDTPEERADHEKFLRDIQDMIDSAEHLGKAPGLTRWESMEHSWNEFTKGVSELVDSMVNGISNWWQNSTLREYCLPIASWVSDVCSSAWSSLCSAFVSVAQLAGYYQDVAVDNMLAEGGALENAVAKADPERLQLDRSLQDLIEAVPDSVTVDEGEYSLADFKAELVLPAENTTAGWSAWVARVRAAWSGLGGEEHPELKKAAGESMKAVVDSVEKSCKDATPGLWELAKARWHGGRGGDGDAERVDEDLTGGGPTPGSE